jgi:hypothetical protein
MTEQEQDEHLKKCLSIINDWAEKNKPSRKHKVQWKTIMGKKIKPRFSPENIWFTIEQISEEAQLSVSTVSMALESEPRIVRASNLETSNGEPVYASRIAYNENVTFAGKIRSVLVNRVVG